MEQFYQDLFFSEAEIISKEEIISRIENFVIKFLQALTSSSPSSQQLSFEMISRDKKNTFELSTSLRQGKNKRIRRITNKKSTKAYSQVWKLLSLILYLLQEDKHMTQREIYYLFIVYFSSQIELNNIILDVVSILQVPRELLHIISSSRGFIGGSLMWKEGSQDDVNLENHVVHIPGYFPRKLGIKSRGARYIIVVEKYGVFKQLIGDRFFKTIPCVLITACGYPDLATRMVVHHLHDRLKIPVLGIFDFNPHGMNILMNYMFGSIRFGLEAFKYAVPIKWVGIHSKDVEELQLVKDNLSKDDKRMMKRLWELNFVNKNEEYSKELEKMKYKVEIQTLNNISFSYLSKVYLKKKILKREYF